VIVGIGTDIVRIDRVARLIHKFGDVFLNRVFTPEERRPQAPPAHYAKRFAAKEALLKALGTGLRAGMSWQDITVTKTPLNQPRLQVSGGVAKALPHAAQIHVSLSDDGGMALAFVVVEMSSFQKSIDVHPYPKTA